MAPIKVGQKTSKHARNSSSSKNSALHKVQGGRLGRAPSIHHKTTNKKTAKELDADMDHYWEQDSERKELFPSISAQKSVSKEFFSTLSKPSLSRSKSSSTVRQENKGKELLPDLLQTRVPQEKEESTRGKPQKPKKLDRRAAYLKSVNLKQARVHRTKDAIAKRMFALQIHPNAQRLQDVRDVQTIHFSTVRLDVDQMDEFKKLNFNISCGFWGASSTFSPAKLFNLSLKKLGTPTYLQKLVLGAADIHKAGKQVGINTHDSAVGVIGYEVMFPKGFRYSSVNYNDIKHIELITYIPPEEKVLINTPCALKEFFLQTGYSNTSPNVSLAVIARIGMITSDPVHGGVSAKAFDIQWRSDHEKKLATEEKRLLLEQQQFADVHQRVLTREKMEAIQARAERAVQLSRAVPDDDVIDEDDIVINTEAPVRVAKTKVAPEIEEFLLDIGFKAGWIDEDLISIEFSAEESEEE